MKSSDGLNAPYCSKSTVQDCLFLSLVILLSLILYIQRLGFYLDDYAFLKVLTASSTQSLFGLGHALYSEEVNTQKRPMQILFIVGLYWLFGPYPLMYHMANAIVLLSAVVLFYLVLREMGQPRLLTLAVPLVYGLLPHYSTDRFWVASSPATLSIALYFLSLYADLRALRHQLAHIHRWKLLSLLSLLGSGLAYEVVLPLFLLNLWLVWNHAQQLYGRALGKHLVYSNIGILLLSNLLSLVLVVGFKTLITLSLGAQTGYQLGTHRRYVDHLIYLASGALRVNYGIYGIGLPYVLWRSIHIAPGWLISVLSGFLGLIVFWYLSYIAHQPRTMMPSKADCRTYMAVGFGVFGLGYTMFLSTDRIVFASASIDNRVAIAAAIGVALSFVGGLGRFSLLVRSHLVRQRMFCLLIALLCLSGFLIINTVATFWITAYQHQQVILADIRQRVPELSAGSTLILDGVCPEHGPAVVFKCHYDLAGALIMACYDASLRADVVTPSLQVEEKGIALGERFYPYDEKLLVYNFSQKMLHRLTNAEAARRYAQTLASTDTCSPATWGWRTSSPLPQFN
jgi:hypothetical protein